jgi:hypothetical protein
MAASNWFAYNEAKKYLLTGDLDLNGGALRMKLINGTKAATVSNFTRSTFASLSHITTNLKTAVKTPGTIYVSTGTSAKETKFTSSAVVFSASGGTVTSIQYAVLGISGGKALGWCKLSMVAFSLTAGNTLTITPNASGIFTLTGGVS